MTVLLTNKIIELDFSVLRDAPSPTFRHRKNVGTKRHCVVDANTTDNDNLPTTAYSLLSPLHNFIQTSKCFTAHERLDNPSVALQPTQNFCASPRKAPLRIENIPNRNSLHYYRPQYPLCPRARPIPAALLEINAVHYCVRELRLFTRASRPLL